MSIKSELSQCFSGSFKLCVVAYGNRHLQSDPSQASVDIRSLFLTVENFKHTVVT